MGLGCYLVKYDPMFFQSNVFYSWLVVSGLFFVTNFILSILKSKGDQFILPLVSLLTGMGTFMILRLKPELFFHQIIWVVLGVIAFASVVLFLRDFRLILNYYYLWFALGIVLLVITIIFGKEIGGARNWLRIGKFNVETAEIVKVLFVFFLAGYLAERTSFFEHLEVRFLGFSFPHPQDIGPLLLFWGFSVALLAFQKELGTVLLFFGTFLAMFFVVSGSVKKLLWGVGLFAISGFLGYKFFHHVQLRVQIWLNPWQNPHGSSYQIIQSLFAIGEGGFVGKGLGLGHPNLIPEAHTDFIFAAFIEELGLVTGIFILLVYLGLIYRGFRISLSQQDNFRKMLACGLTTVIALQTMIIVGGVTKLIPLTGITLPFISYGGSSLVTNFLIIGILFKISSQQT